jgi:hypothetical protein
MNEDVNLRKRDGVRAEGQSQFADMRLRDDTGQIGARIGCKDWESMQAGGEGGKYFLQSIPVGSRLLVRAKFFHGLKFAFVQKWKLLS